MTDLISKVLQQLSGSYNNILNNNLNNNLSNLTIIEVLLGVLSVITGFFGMNVPIPFMTVSPAGFSSFLVVSFFVWFWPAICVGWFIKNNQ